MRYPTPGDYQAALQDPGAAFADPELQAAEPADTLMGLPRVLTGAFAAVVPFEHGGRRWAVKCFLTDAAEQRARYEAVARHLAAHSVDAFADFDYQPRGVQVDGRALPLLKMAWVDGAPLNRYVAEHLDDPDALAALADRWAALMETLAGAGVAHGDLQHGNVLVETDGRLRLVDYDTTYVPALRGRPSAEVGHRNYQHPDRDEGDFGPYLDRFAALVVYVALQACRRDPALWTRYDTGENLLFRAADFYDPGASPLFADLRALDGMGSLVDALQASCFLEPETVPTLADVRAGHVPAAPRRSVRRARAGGERRRDRLERAWLPAAAAGLVVAVVAVVAGAPVLGASLLAGDLAAAGLAAARRYRQTPVVRRRRRLDRELAFFDRVIARVGDEIDALQAQRRHAVDRTETLLARRLHELREAALEDRLKHHFIQEAAGEPGVSHKVVVRLKAATIRTAYHASPERVAAAPGLSDGSRAAVDRWRAALVARYRDALPEALSPAEAQRMRRHAAREAEALDAEVGRLREKVGVQQAERAQVAERRAGLPPLTFGRYLAYLLRLRPWPEPPAHMSAAPAPALPSSTAGGARPWWREAG